MKQRNSGMGSREFRGKDVTVDRVAREGLSEEVTFELRPKDEKIWEESVPERGHE